jgi:hypothetical protein
MANLPILEHPVRPIDKGFPPSYLLERLAGSALVFEPGMWGFAAWRILLKDRSEGPILA